MHDAANRLRRTRSLLMMEHGRAATQEETAAAMGLAIEKVDAIDASVAAVATVSMHAQAYASSSATVTIERKLADPKIQPRESCEADMRHDDLMRILDAALTAREAHILRCRFGLNYDRRVQTLQQIAQGMTPTLTRERIRQLEEQALQKLRSCRPSIREKMLDYLLDE